VTARGQSRKQLDNSLAIRFEFRRNILDN